MLTRRAFLGVALLSGCTRPVMPVPVGPGTSPPGSGPATQRRADFGLSVMSWNVMTQGLGPDWYDPAMPREHHQWRARAGKVAGWLAFTDPDLVGFQEALGVRDAKGAASNLMVDMLPDRAWAHIDHYLPIMYRASLFDLADAAVVEIYPGSIASPWPRFCAWARLVHRPSGGHLFVFNTHLQPFQTAEVAAIRAGTIRRLIAEMNRINPSHSTPAVLTGDLNARSNERRPVFAEHLTRLAADGWRNSEAVAKRDLTQVPGASTLNGFGAKAGSRWHYRMISTSGRDYDYVWVRKGTRVSTWQTVVGPGVRHRLVDGRRYAFFADGPVPSDHCPVLAQIIV